MDELKAIEDLGELKELTKFLLDKLFIIYYSDTHTASIMPTVLKSEEFEKYLKLEELCKD